MRSRVFLSVVLLSFIVTTEPAWADCAKRHIYLSLAADAAHHMQVYSSEGDDNMRLAAKSEGRHWYNMAQTEQCSRSSLAHDALDDRVDRILFAGQIRRGEQVLHEQALERQRQHAANVAAAWAKKHPSKWTLANPGRTPNPYAAHPNQPARVLKAVEPDTPRVAYEQRIQGTVQVVVSLDEKGQVVDAVIQWSPSPILNEAALAAARKSTFRPEIKNGKPIATKYIFSVDFTSQ